MQQMTTCNKVQVIPSMYDMHEIQQGIKNECPTLDGKS